MPQPAPARPPCFSPFSLIFHDETAKWHLYFFLAGAYDCFLKDTLRGDTTLFTLDDIASRMNARQQVLMDRDHRTHAAVALILRGPPESPELLFIKRAHHADDPWSGDLGFPGGKVEKEDRNAQQAAERETLEEIGLDLGMARCLGRLSDIAGAHLPVRISCFVYASAGPATLEMSDEVRSVFWVPLQLLLEPDRHREMPVRFSGRELTSPAILIPETGTTPLWGITYRLVMQFLHILGYSPASIPVTAGLPADPSEK